MEIRALLSAMWRSRTGPLLVAAQVAITFALIVNVAYIIQQRFANIAEPTGMDVPNLFWVESRAYTPEYNHAAAVRADLDYLNSLPGVTAAATTNNVPQGFNTTSFEVAADPAVLASGGGPKVTFFLGSQRYIDTLGLQLVAGRAHDAASVAAPPKDFGELIQNWPAEVVVTKNLADRLWPQGDALGKALHIGTINKSSTVVGIVERMQHMPVTGNTAASYRMVVLVPGITPAPNTIYMVRTQAGRRDATMARVEKEFASMQPGRYVAAIEAFSDTVRRIRASARTSIMTLTVVAVFVLGVTLVGMAGLASFTVAARTKQLGTRRAIGATKFHILRYFLVENWLITSVGVVVGCILAIAAGVKLSLMYQMPRLPLFYLVAGVLVLWAFGLLAVLIPARRAASTYPAVATRTV